MLARLCLLICIGDSKNNVRGYCLNIPRFENMLNSFKHIKNKYSRNTVRIRCACVRARACACVCVCVCACVCACACASAPADGMTHLDWAVLYSGMQACYIRLRSGWGSDGNLYNVLRGLRDFWKPRGA